MLKKLKNRYPNAEIKSIPTKLSQMIWFYLDDEEKYIGIPTSDLSNPEIELLKALFPIYQDKQLLNTSIQSQKWYDYLFEENSTFPSNQINVDYRLIQFTLSQIKEEFEHEDWQEAIKALFPNEVVLVFLSASEGIIVEKRQDYILSIDELNTSIHALESDFYCKIHFYIGMFNTLENELNSLFQLEQTLFRFALKEMAKDRIFSLSNVFPLYLLKNIPSGTRYPFFSSIYDVFKEDVELRRTIKLYLENHSNASLTAKQLFLHRNSLQYRIDKFVEKTGYDLKSFPVSVIVYLACLDFEYNL
ncbi:PucR family transcriptional regulator [Heyndrickxia sp. NPDC080065]|uniref:PucR family transcriptional regulator n=1 Tax=Heyndrickxia sp. NPDC080065 TaxID=3390568 RepID=UPI003D011E89